MKERNFLIKITGVVVVPFQSSAVHILLLNAF